MDEEEDGGAKDAGTPRAFLPPRFRDTQEAICVYMPKQQSMWVSDTVPRT